MLTVPGSGQAAVLNPTDPGLIPGLIARLLIPSPSSTTTTTPATSASPAMTSTTTTAPASAAPAPPPPAIAAPVAKVVNTQVGIASWYNDKAGSCAHRTAPIGTKMKVTNVVNGQSVQCTVTNRGPYSPGRVIDLSDEGFAKIAPLSQGLADVRVEW